MAKLNIYQFELKLYIYIVTVDLTNYEMRGRMLLNSDMWYSYLFANLQIEIYNKYTKNEGKLVFFASILYDNLL